MPTCSSHEECSYGQYCQVTHERLHTPRCADCLHATKLRSETAVTAFWETFCMPILDEEAMDAADSQGGDQAGVGRGKAAGRRLASAVRLTGS